ncbi:hypothetical protein [Streptomyces sp. NPDC041003]|uniref:hypothetical protein n=1 Tax=Streptomyces sp. NPDC041003 TaxID=3155730 RepID=UPI0034112326
MTVKEPVLIDEVLEKHEYQENRFVTRARIGPQSQVDAEKEAGQQAVRDTFVSNMHGALGATKTGAASAGLVQPAPRLLTTQSRHVTVANPELVARYERLANERLPAVIDQTLAAERATPGRARLAQPGTQFDTLRVEVGNAPTLTPQQRIRAVGILREARVLAREDFSGLQGKAMARLRAGAQLQAIEGQLVAAGDAQLNPDRHAPD